MTKKLTKNQRKRSQKKASKPNNIENFFVVLMVVFASIGAYTTVMTVVNFFQDTYYKADMYTTLRAHLDMAEDDNSQLRDDLHSFEYYAASADCGDYIKADDTVDCLQRRDYTNFYSQEKDGQ